LGLCDFRLFLPDNCYFDGKIFDNIGASDSPYLSEAFGRQDLRFLLADLQVQIRSEFFKLVNDHLYSMLVV
jgi:hypothetical protein